MSNKVLPVYLKNNDLTRTELSNFKENILSTFQIFGKIIKTIFNATENEH